MQSPGGSSGDVEEVDLSGLMESVVDSDEDEELGVIRGVHFKVELFIDVIWTPLLRSGQNNFVQCKRVTESLIHLNCRCLVPLTCDIEL